MRLVKYIYDNFSSGEDVREVIARDFLSLSPDYADYEKEL